MQVARHASYEGVKGCAVEAAMDVIGGKWKSVLLYQLIEGERGFNELRKKFPELSQRMLSRQLQELESHGVVLRRIYPGKPPRTGYTLTPLGMALIPCLHALRQWGDQLLNTPPVHPSPRLLNPPK